MEKTKSKKVAKYIGASDVATGRPTVMELQILRGKALQMGTDGPRMCDIDEAIERHSATRPLGVYRGCECRNMHPGWYAFHSITGGKWGITEHRSGDYVADHWVMVGPLPDDISREG